MNNETSVYFSACCYASDIIGVDAPRYFSRLQQLSQTNSLDELKVIIDSWAHGTKPTRTAASGPWAIGSSRGSSVLFSHDRGIFYWLRCSCGELFHTSLNDSVSEGQCKCAGCLADDLAKTDPTKIEKLSQAAVLIGQWYDAHDLLIWREVHRACFKRGIVDEMVKRDLHALCWTKIFDKADQYKDRGFKVSAWLVRVAHNCLIDFFDKEWNRTKHLKPFLDDAADMGIPNPNPLCAEERVPARRVVPQGAGPLYETGWDTSPQAGA